MTKRSIHSPLNKLASFVSRRITTVFFICLIVFLPIAALGLRYKDALWTLSWGSQRVLCKIPLLSTRLQGCISIFQYLSQPDKPVNIGMYDPENQFSDSSYLAFDHYFIQWHSYNPNKLLADLRRSQLRNRWPLVTVEPYLLPDLNAENLFIDITNGLYDKSITEICSDLAQYGRPAFFRWGHEMENVSGRYPWASYDYQGYILAYQYVVKKCRAITETLFYVWSPVGDDLMEIYWPGPEYTDYVGLSVYSFPEWEKDQYGEVRSFQNHFMEKYQRAKIFTRPIIIAEMGVTGDWEYQKQWWTDLFQNLSDFPLLKTVVYFNSQDTPGVWGKSSPNPDWRLSQSVFQ